MKNLKKKKINIRQLISEQKNIGTTQDFKNNFISNSNFIYLYILYYAYIYLKYCFPRKNVIQRLEKSVNKKQL